MQIKSEATRKLETCKNKLFNYMIDRNIKPYGKIVEFDDGFKMWGAKVVNGKEENNLYYSDLKCIAIWRGVANGFVRIPKDVHNEIRTSKPFRIEDKEEKSVEVYSPKIKRRPKNRIKATIHGVETIYGSVRECAEELGVDTSFIYQRSNSGNSYMGMHFEKLPLT